MYVYTVDGDSPILLWRGGKFLVEEIYALLHDAAGYLNKNAMADYRQACHRAKQMLAHRMKEFPELKGELLLLQAMSGDAEPDEVYAMLARAGELLQGPSRVFTPETGYVENSFNMVAHWGEIAGRAGDFAAHSGDIQGICTLLQRLTGFGCNMYEAMCAQLAYYQGDFETVRALARDVRFDGQTLGMAQVMLLEILAGCAKHTLDHKLWKNSYGRLRDIAAGKLPATRSGRQQAETVCAMLDMSLGCMHDVPDWVKIGGFGIIPAPWGYEIVSDEITHNTLPMAMVSHVQYLCFSGERVHALQSAELIQKCYGMRNIVVNAYINLLRAGSYLGLDKVDRARQAIDDAMDLIAPDGLWLIAAESVSTMGEMIYASARRHDPSAPEKIRSLGEGLLEKLAPLRKELIGGEIQELTQREREIAALVMQGFSNAEIAQQLNVTVRTVKYHLENVYSKLNITRRSKLVSAMDKQSGAKLASWVK